MTQKSKELEKEVEKEVEKKVEKPKVYTITAERIELTLARLQTMKLTAQEHQFIVSALQSLIKPEENGRDI